MTSAKVLESEPKTDDSDDESKRPTRGPAKKQFKFKYRRRYMSMSLRRNSQCVHRLDLRDVEQMEKGVVGSVCTCVDR